MIKTFLKNYKKRIEFQAIDKQQWWVWFFYNFYNLHNEKKHIKKYTYDLFLIWTWFQWRQQAALVIIHSRMLKSFECWVQMINSKHVATTNKENMTFAYESLSLMSVVEQKMQLLQNALKKT